MVKKCDITNVKPMTGNNVSHAVNKTKRRFFPNLQNTSFFSEILGKNIRLKVTSKGIKTVEKNGGIDKFLLNSKNSKLNTETRKLKKILASKTS
ncbi:MAG: 50S ribosomal protein L28 [Rickettsiales bacterium]|nr:50S ribosomal protein L28 [Rickettsiales bacterium]RPG13394.1 MAG: 50S ribosomal protein L28 [Pelagibacteraceae bacterium TMED195]